MQKGLGQGPGGIGEMADPSTSRGAASTSQSQRVLAGDRQPACRQEGTLCPHPTRTSFQTREATLPTQQHPGLPVGAVRRNQGQDREEEPMLRQGPCNEMLQDSTYFNWGIPACAYANNELIMNE